MLGVFQNANFVTQVRNKLFGIKAGSKDALDGNDFACALVLSTVHGSIDTGAHLANDLIITQGSR